MLVSKRSGEGKNRVFSNHQQTQNQTDNHNDTDIQESGLNDTDIQESGHNDTDIHESEQKVFTNEGGADQELIEKE